MSEQVDQLFGGAPPAPVDRLRKLWMLLIGAGVMNTLGWPCLLVPGTLLTLWVWHRAEEETGRALADNEHEDARSSRRLRNVAFGLIGWSVIGMMIQVTLYGLWFSQAS